MRSLGRKKTCFSGNALPKSNARAHLKRRKNIVASLSSARSSLSSARSSLSSARSSLISAHSCEQSLSPECPLETDRENVSACSLLEEPDPAPLLAPKTHYWNPGSCTGLENGFHPGGKPTCRSKARTPRAPFFNFALKGCIWYQNEFFCQFSYK